MKGSLPHILLLVADQFRHDVVTPSITPNLHAFETSNGTTTFHHAYTSTPTCTPARAALLTGKSPWAHGLLGYAKYTNCEKYVSTLPRYLRDRGYRTIVVGKNHFGHVKYLHGYQNETLYEGLKDVDDYDRWFDNTLPGMDPEATCGLDWNDWAACPYYYEEYVHPTSWTTREALKTLEEYFGSDNSDPNAVSPLFLKVSYHRPHSPYDPPRRLFDQYLSGGSKANITQLKRFVNDSSWDVAFKNHKMTPSAWAGDPGRDAARHTRAGYLASVEFVDENIVKIFDYLKVSGLWDEFAIIWTSDHGDQNGDHYLWRKGYPWEASAHIPLAIKLPHTSKRQFRQSDAVVELRDIAPTLYDMADILNDVQKHDPEMDGKSLMPVLNGTQSSVRDWLDLEHSWAYDDAIHWSALVGYLQQGSNGCNYWKYIFHAFDASEQLFCLMNDPNETHDLAPLKEFHNVLLTWRARLVEQFEAEGRGPNWVQGNRLKKRTTNTVYGKNFPCSTESNQFVFSVVGWLAGSFALSLLFCLIAYTHCLFCRRRMHKAKAESHHPSRIRSFSRVAAADGEDEA